MTVKDEGPSPSTAGRHWFAARGHSDTHPTDEGDDSSTPPVFDEDEVALSFDNDGFVILSQVVPNELLRKWQDFGEDYFQRCFITLHQMGHTSAPVHQVPSSDNQGVGREKCEYVLGMGALNGFREVVMRSPGRYELSLLNLEQQEFEKVSNTSIRIPDTSRILKILEPLLPRLLGRKDDSSPAAAAAAAAESSTSVKLCHLSLLVATPGSVDQGWHADGGHLSVLEHLPCHCFNIFIPLEDIPLEMGPTEFRPGGHYLTRNLAPMMLAARCRKTLRSPVWPPLKLGDVLLFDYRVLHRGRANNTLRNRHVLVLTFCEQWFEDILNFPKRSMLVPCGHHVADVDEETVS
jgi:hypothetical protein